MHFVWHVHRCIYVHFNDMLMICPHSSSRLYIPNIIIIITFTTDYSPSGNYMVSYYCGHMSSNWWYEGGLVYSKTPTISPQDSERVAKVIEESMGRSIDQYCAPKTSGCHSGNGSGRQS